MAVSQTYRVMLHMQRKQRWRRFADVHVFDEEMNISPCPIKRNAEIIKRHYGHTYFKWKDNYIPVTQEGDVYVVSAK